jgi:3-methylcrotonyl-CoA carboxylase alpha subunit
VEFLVDAAGGFYFMEMNTRIQVEHPVTEMITGLDLVEWQLRIADGEALPLSQQQIAMRGHAIEVRIYAEVPEAGFLPSSGTLTRFAFPPAAAGLRLETGMERGERVGIDYDPMLAKLIVHADTRAAAVAALRQALAQVRIAGVGNNVMFLRRLAASAAFAGGQLDVGTIEREHTLAVGRHEPADARVLAAAALWTLLQERPAAPSMWNAADGWRLNGQLTRTLVFADANADANADAGAGAGAAANAPIQADGADTASGAPLLAVTVDYRADGLWLAIGERRDAASLSASGNDCFFLRYGDDGLQLQIEQQAGALRLLVGEHEYRLRWLDPLADAGQAYVAEASLAAPMPGRVIAQLVVAGSAVAKGAPLLILEAMKMEHTICAPANGTVRGYRAAVGEQVKEGWELIEFEPTPTRPPR